MSGAIAAGAVVTLALTGLVGDEPPKVVPAAEARAHEGKTCTVELTVRSSKHAVPRKTYFLDSEVDFKEPKNVGILISDEDAERFREVGIDDPAAHYRNKTILVTGKVEVQRETNYVRIRVTEPGQIQVVE